MRASGFVGALAFAALSLLGGQACAQSSERVRVHLEGEDAAILQIQVGDDKWRSVCVAPCDMKVYADARYRIDGEGIRSSAPFSLDASSGSETIDIDAAPSSGAESGFLIFGLGVLAGVAGAFVTDIGASAETCEGTASIPGYSRCERTLSELVPVGILVMVGAAITTAAGIYVVANTRSTNVTQTASTPTARVRFFASDSLPMSGPRESSGVDPLRRISARISTPIVSVSF